MEMAGRWVKQTVSASRPGHGQIVPDYAFLYVFNHDRTAVGCMCTAVGCMCTADQDPPPQHCFFFKNLLLCALMNSVFHVYVQ